MGVTPLETHKREEDIYGTMKELLRKRRLDLKQVVTLSIYGKNNYLFSIQVQCVCILKVSLWSYLLVAHLIHFFLKILNVYVIPLEMNSKILPETKQKAGN